MKRGKEAKDNRRKKAEELQQNRSKRSDREHLALLDKKGYRAIRERTCLKQKIERT